MSVEEGEAAEKIGEVEGAGDWKKVYQTVGAKKLYDRTNVGHEGGLDMVRC